ncbi:MAG TPA: TlpA disulfide reductase family protein [Bacteroidales bacterium]|nr:TlpA disulfide reductase family protein [Bacteroidales bacterium]
MKKIVIAIFAVLLFGCANENQYTIEGKIDGGEPDQWVYLKKKGVNSNTMLDSARLGRKGEFEFKGVIEYPQFFNLTTQERFATLLIKPGEDVRFHTRAGNFHDYTVKGSPGSQQVQTLDQRLRKTKSKLDSLARLYRRKQDQASAEELEHINEQYRRILDRQRDSSVAFIINNLKSLASIMALYQKVNEDLFVLYKNSDLQYISLVADSLRDEYPRSEQVKALIANKEDLMRKYRNLELQSTVNRMGKVSRYPEVDLPNLQGDTISLQELDDKMILLSFWASWSEPSIQRSLEMKSLYKRYHDQGFEIYQVSLDQSVEDWQRAVRFDQLPWINVSSLNGFESYAARIYNVQELPTDFLIHQERGIISKNPSKQELRRQLSIALD